MTPAHQNSGDSDAELRAFFSMLLSDGGLREVRALDVVRTSYPHKTEHVEAGYFRPEDLDALIWIAGHYRQDAGHFVLPYGGLSILREPPKGVYISLNPIKSAAYAKGPARMVVARRGETSNDGDVERRTTLLIDIDSPRAVTGVSATDAEKEQAAVQMAQVREFLTEQGWTEPIVVDSGNGFQLLHRIDLPADHGGLAERVLKGLAAKFPVPDGGIDTSVHNAARIARLPCTWNRKGHSVGERPHRMARVLSVPNSFDVVPIEMLNLIAELAPAAPSAHSRPRTGAKTKSGTGADIEQAVTRWNADNPQAFPTHASPCPICGSPDGLKASSGDASRWTCFSSRHCEADGDSKKGAGIRGNGCFTGDALDIEAWTSKRSRMQVLQDDGYLQPRSRAMKPRPGDTRMRENGERTADAASAENAAPDRKLNKPTVLCPGEHDQIRVGDDDFITAVLKELPDGVLYRRGVVVGELIGPRGSMKFAEVKEQRARAIIDEHMQIERLEWNAIENAFAPKYMPCSRDLAALFLATAARTTILRELRAIVQYPVFLGDQFVLARPGWNEGGVFYDEPAELEGLQPLAEGAIDCLDELTSDFPFRCDASRENSFGMMLTALLAHAIGGNIPIHLVVASLERTGKGLLIDVELGIVILGEAAAPVLQIGSTEEEREKRITAAILEGATVVHFDNLPAEQMLDSASLASLATARMWRGRILGRSEIIRLPNTLIPVFSGNNVKASGELTKRSVPIVLQPKDDHPEERDDFKHQDIRSYARKKRRKVIGALLGMVVAWRDAGRPACSHPIRMGGFEEWARVVGGVLAHAGATSWMTNYSSWIRAGDEFSADAEVLIEHWWKVHGSAEVTPATILSMVRQLEVFLRVFVGVETGTSIRLARQVLGPLENRPVCGRLMKRRAHGNAGRYWLAEVV